MKKVKKRNSVLYLLRYKNLAKEVENYGSKLTVKGLLKTYVIVLSLCVMIGYLYKIPTYGYIAILLTGLLILPEVILSSCRAVYEKNRFYETQKYMTKMLYYFQRSEKILDSLKSASEIFKSGDMSVVINKAIKYIEGEADEDEVDKTLSDSKEDEADKTLSDTIESRALKIIEKRFPNEKIRTIHKFMLSIEYQGGDPTFGTQMLLQSNNCWIKRVRKLQQQLTSVHKNNIAAIFVLLILCVVMTRLSDFVPSISNYLDISNNLYVQVSAVILIMTMLLFYKSASKKMCINWIEEQAERTNEEWEKEYQDYVNYDKQKEKTKSMIHAAISLLISAVLYFLTKSILVLAIGFVITIFLSQTYKIGYQIVEKNVKKEINKAFPAWLINVALLMQHENVQMAILKSYDNAPGILRVPIENMLTELDDDPNASDPFLNFAKEANVPDITDAVSGLYSISQAAGGNVEMEFKAILETNNELMDIAEQEKNEDTLAMFDSGMKVPAFFGTAKLLVDAVVLLMTFLSVSNSFL